MFNPNYIHFVSNNSTHQLTIPQEVVPFNVKYMESQVIVEGMLSSLNLPTSFFSKYNPKGFISNKSRDVILQAYVH